MDKDQEAETERMSRALQDAYDTIENLNRHREREKAHAHAVQEALTAAQKENIQLHAQIGYVKEKAEKSLHQFNNLTETLYERIDAMADEWEAQIRNRFNLSEKEREELLLIVQPFRPSRLEQAATGQSAVS